MAVITRFHKAKFIMSQAWYFACAFDHFFHRLKFEVEHIMGGAACICTILNPALNKTSVSHLLEY